MEVLLRKDTSFAYLSILCALLMWHVHESANSKEKEESMTLAVFLFGMLTIAISIVILQLFDRIVEGLMSYFDAYEERD